MTIRSDKLLISIGYLIMAFLMYILFIDTFDGFAKKCVFKLKNWSREKLLSFILAFGLYALLIFAEQHMETEVLWYRYTLFIIMFSIFSIYFSKMLFHCDDNTIKTFFRFYVGLAIIGLLVMLSLHIKDVNTI